jgi:hypothetical protein
VVFVDEKKFRAGSVTGRSMQYGYAPAGERLPLRYAVIGLLTTTTEDNDRLVEALQNDEFIAK